MASNACFDHMKYILSAIFTPFNRVSKEYLGFLNILIMHCSNSSLVSFKILRLRCLDLIREKRNADQDSSKVQRYNKKPKQAKNVLPPD